MPDRMHANTAQALIARNKRVHVALCHRSYDVTEDEKERSQRLSAGKQKRKSAYDIPVIRSAKAPYPLRICIVFTRQRSFRYFLCFFPSNAQNTMETRLILTYLIRLSINSSRSILLRI